MTYEYRSNGKLLLTGEYLVLQGAEALALPLQKGQTLRVKPVEESNKLLWKSIYEDQIFFEAVFSTKNVNILETNDEEHAVYLQNLLKKAIEYVPALPSIPGYSIEATLDFPLEWGLGSSSTLITNIAHWLNINPFRLNRAITNGSGYDIACAHSGHPIIYRLLDNYPDYRKINLNFPFKDSIYFVYTGKKQSSFNEVKGFLEDTKDHSYLFPKIKEINKKIIKSQSIKEFKSLLTEHEELIASVLGTTTIKDQFFGDFPGAVKSLGAWGGDFILVTWEGTREELKESLDHHNMGTFFSWNELVKNGKYD
jgi:mevalonate kinase